MPIFVRRSRSKAGKYVVEVGLRQIDRETLGRLERESAVLRICEKAYNVSAQRFGKGFTKLPVDEPALCWESIVRLTGTDQQLAAVWGRPEDSPKAMAFIRDPDADQGRRVTNGDDIPVGSDLFLLALERESTRIRRAFGKAKRLGTVGSPRPTLSVFAVRVPERGGAKKAAEKYLEECGYFMGEEPATPGIVWPPSLTSSGEITPLFRESRCIFVAKPQVGEGSLYVQTRNDAAGKVRKLPIIRCGAGEYGFAVLLNIYDMCLIAGRDTILGTAMLLRADGDYARRALAYDPPTPRMELLPDGVAEISMEAPFAVRVRKRNSPSVLLSSDEGATSLRLDAVPGARFTVLVPLHRGRGYRAVAEWEVAPSRGAGNAEAGMLDGGPVQTRLTSGQRHAVSRRMGRVETKDAGMPSGKLKAIARKAGKKV